MKQLFTLMLALCCCVAVQAQSRVTEKELIGEWKMILDLDEIEDEIKRDLEDENWLARRFANSLADLALDLVDQVDVNLDFREGGEVRIEIDIFGHDEVEYAEWYINKDGELIIEDEDRRSRRRGRRSFHFGDDHDVWMMEGNRLVSYDRGYRGRLEKQEVYMVKR